MSLVEYAGCKRCLRAYIAVYLQIHCNPPSYECFHQTQCIITVHVTRSVKHRLRSTRTLSTTLSWVRLRTARCTHLLWRRSRPPNTPNYIWLASRSLACRISGTHSRAPDSAIEKSYAKSVLATAFHAWAETLNVNLFYLFSFQVLEHDTSSNWQFRQILRS